MAHNKIMSNTLEKREFGKWSWLHGNVLLSSTEEHFDIEELED